MRIPTLVCSVTHTHTRFIWYGTRIHSDRLARAIHLCTFYTLLPQNEDSLSGTSQEYIDMLAIYLIEVVVEILLMVMITIIKIMEKVIMQFLNSYFRLMQIQ